MRGRISNSVLHYVGVILVAFSILQVAPLLVSAVYNETVRFPTRIYAIPALIALSVGWGLVVFFKPKRLTSATAMAIGALGWFALSLVGAIPYWLALDITYLDAFFEAASGFTTTGATLFTGLSILPKSLLLWRGLTQWIGGLGIFTLFMFVIRGSGMRHVLIEAEAHKAASERFSPGIFTSLRILWAIYTGLTVICGAALWIEGLSPFDAAVHALTTVSTGGFSVYDDSIGHFAAAGMDRAPLIEYTITLFMFLGGTSFLVHWNLLRRRWRAALMNPELRAWLILLVGAFALVSIGDRARVATVGLHEHLRTSLFHVVSIATTTGFTLHELTSSWFSPAALQVFLVLMVIGGCVGSTSGGLKVWRVTVMGQLLRYRLRRMSRSPQEILPLTLGRQVLDRREVDRSIAIAVSWVLGTLIFWMLGTLLSELGAWESLSAAVAMIGNIGPNFVASNQFVQLAAGTKVVYIIAMVAGRLEVLPFLLIFSRRVWR